MAVVKSTGFKITAELFILQTAMERLLAKLIAQKREILSSRQIIEKMQTWFSLSKSSNISYPGACMDSSL